MRRWISVLTMACMLFLISPFQVLAQEAEKGSGNGRSPFAAGRGARQKLPPNARIGSTAERRAAWARLSPEERQRVLEQFQALVGPALREAAERHRGPQKPKDRHVMPDRLGKKVRSARPAQSGGGRLALTDERTGRMMIEEPWEEPWEPIEYPPEVTASASPTSGAAPLTVQFSSFAYDPDGWVTNYYWNFGDGGYSFEPSPVHTYTTPGDYSAWLSVTDNSGYSAWTVVGVSVTSGGGGNQPPGVSATASPTSGNVPLTVTFNAFASDPDGFITSYSWDFGDGQSSGQASPPHTYQGAGSYQATVTVTDNAGATTSAAVSIQAKALSGPDTDGDSLPDSFETSVADAFTPVYHVSTGEQAGTGFSLFGDFEPQTPVQTFPPVPPISHYRVTPVGFTTNVYGQQLGLLQIDYLTIWNRDDGLDVGGDCRFFASILGGLVGFSLTGALDGAGPHFIDNERSAVLVAAPTSGFQYSADPAAYSAYDYYTAAHENTFFDKSTYFSPSQPIPAGGHLHLAFSRSKHGTYSFNPDHYPLFPDWVIFSTYATLDSLYFFGAIDYWYYLYFLYIADTVYFSCVVERFGEQGGTFAGTRINVGELSSPINGSTFIKDNTYGLRSKFAPLWIVQ